MRFLFSLVSLAILVISCTPKTASDSQIAVRVSFLESVEEEPLDGRLLLMLSDDPSAEPRYQINAGLNTQLVFGMNVEGMQPGQAITFEETAYGFPYKSLTEVPAGTYQAQALLHVYETFNLSTGHTVKLPMDNGEGQQWNRSPSL